MTVFELASKHGLWLEELPVYSSTNPKYELWAPEGKRFIDGVHSYIEYRAMDVREEIASLLKQFGSIDRYLEDCPEDCHCKEIP